MMGKAKRQLRQARGAVERMGREELSRLTMPELESRYSDEELQAMSRGQDPSDEPPARWEP